jgi:hypothetical protein
MPKLGPGPIDLDGEIKINVIKLPIWQSRSADGGYRNLAVSFNGLTRDEVATLVDAVIKIEQARTGNVLTPTEYGNRFSGLDLT